MNQWKREAQNNGEGIHETRKRRRGKDEEISKKGRGVNKLMKK